MGLGPNWYHIGNKTCYIPVVRKLYFKKRYLQSLSKGLKVSFLISCLLSELWSLKCQKWSVFIIFCWWQQKTTHSLGEIFKCIWKILFRSFRKCYGLLSSELPLARKCRIPRFFCWLSSFFIFLPTINHIKHIIFWKTSVRSFGRT